MINYINKGSGLGYALAGLGCYQLDNVWISNNDEAAQAIIDNYDPVPYERTEALKRIIEQADDAASALEASYPEIEKRTFIKQEIEARAYIADDTTAAPTLTIIANARGLTVDVIAQRVVAKADYYTAAAATIIGARQHAEDLIDVETDWKVIQSINLAV